MGMIKKRIDLLKRKKEFLQSQIKKYNISTISDEEFNTWDENKIKKINGKIQLHISKEIFKSKLKEATELEIDSWSSLLNEILSSNSRTDFFKLIEKVPINIKKILGYDNIKKAKRDFKPKPKSYAKKQKLKEPKSVNVIHTPMGNKR